MASWTNNNSTYYINPAYLTFVENSGYGANLIQVSASSSCYISVFIPGVIEYSDADKNYRRWKVTAYNNKFPDNSRFYIYIRLEKDGTSALVIYDKVLRGVHGGEIIEKTDGHGNVTKEEGEYDENHTYYYIHIGEASATDGTSIRSIAYDTGYLTSDMSQNDKGGLNDMWELDKYSTPWLIRAKQWLSSFSVKGFITLVGGLIFKNQENEEKRIVDIKRSTDDDVPVSDETVPTTAYVRSISDDRYLKKYEEDETNYRIKFYDGIEAGHYVKGMIGGSGTRFDGQGYGEMNGLTLREFLEVPELRFNRIDVVSGELWNSIAFGLVESVDTGRRICRIKLEGKERCGLHVYDICRGIFADFGDGTQWEGVDECGFMHLYGFWTSYFTPTKIIENGEGVFSFQYELKAGTTQHPVASMKFAVYGNFVDASRQASAYSTRTYKRYLNKVDTWVIDPDKHIYAQYGDLEGLTIGGMTMHGYGSFQSNSYFTGVQIQFTPQQKLELQGESAYSVVLSDYEGVVTIDDEGNVTGGEMEMMNVVSEGDNVVSGGQNVVTSSYRLQTQVQASRGSDTLAYSPLSPSEGHYVVSINAVGCEAMVLNGSVVVTSVFHTERCYVDIVVNCEGKSTFNLTYRINAVRDGRNPVIADLDNEMDSVACDSKGKVIFGLPVSCTVSMWAGVKPLDIERMDVSVPDGVSVKRSYIDQNGVDLDSLTPEQLVEVKYRRGVVSVPQGGISEDAENTLPIRITAYAQYGGTLYQKDLVFTVNKIVAGENALLYRLSPSASSVKVDAEGVMTADTVRCEVVSSNGEELSVLTKLPEDLSIKYFLDGEAAQDYMYNSPVEISDGNDTVTFQLFWKGKLIDVETIPILLDGSSPVFIDLDNEMFSVACDEEGKVVFMPEMVSSVNMYWGNENLDAKIVEVDAPEGVEVSFSGNRVSVLSISGDATDTLRISVSATAMHGRTEYTRTAHITVNKIRQGQSAWVLDLLPSVSAVKVDGKGRYTPLSVSCRTRLVTGKESSVPAALQDNYSMKYSVDAGGEKSYTYGSEIAVSPEYDKEIDGLETAVTFLLYYSKDNGKESPWVLVDKETVPVLRDAATVFKSTVFIRTNEAPDTPYGGSYESPVPTSTPEWTDGIPSGEEVLWASVCTFSSDGSDSGWSEPAQMTDTASFDVEFSSVESDPGTPDSNPSAWSGTASEDTVWMATRTISNGVPASWQVTRIKGERGEDGADGADGADGKDGQNAMYYEIRASVGSIGFTSTGSYSPSSFIVSEYTVDGASRTPSDRYYIHIYGLKGGSATYLTYTSSVNKYTFNASSYASYDYDAFRFDLRTGSSSSSSLVAADSTTTVAVARDGSNEAAGSMPYNCGEYSSTTRYYYNADRRDVVTYNGGVYMVKAFDADGYISGKLPTNATYWVQASKDIFRAMDTALIDGANIAGFTFKNNVMQSQTGTLTLDGINGKITASAGNIGGFLIGEYSLVNEGIGYDSYYMKNIVSLTPYDGRSVGHTSNDINAMSGGATSNAVIGFSVGIKSMISSVMDETGANLSKFVTTGGYFEGTATSGNMGSVGVWGKSQYSSGSPYILAGVVGTELAAKTGYTKAQAGVIGFSQHNYGVYAKGGRNDLFLANASIGNFGIGELVTNAASMANFVNDYNILMSASDATLPRCRDVPMGRMFLYINGDSSVHKVSRSGSDTIAVSTGAGSVTSINVYENSAVFFIKIGDSKWYAFKAYDEDE